MAHGVSSFEAQRITLLAPLSSAFSNRTAAHDLERCAANAKHLADRVLPGKQRVGHRFANGRDLIGGAHVLLSKTDAVNDRPLVYLDRNEFGQVLPICRLEYRGEIKRWDFAIYKYSLERYSAQEHSRVR